MFSTCRHFFSVFLSLLLLLLLSLSLLRLASTENERIHLLFKRRNDRLLFNIDIGFLIRFTNDRKIRGNYYTKIEIYFVFFFSCRIYLFIVFSFPLPSFEYREFRVDMNDWRRLHFIRDFTKKIVCKNFVNTRESVEK